MTNRTSKTRYLRIAGFAVGAVVIAGVAVVATASAAGMTFGLRPASSQPSDAQVAAVDARATSAVCSDFMKNFANEIHKSQAEINAAFQKAIADTLADEVKNKQITQAQADAIKKKLANQTPCTLPSSAGRPGAAAPAIKAFMQQYFSAAAAALGITEAQLKADLAGGQSLSQVAAAQHVSEADFRTKLIANLKPALDAAVTNKTITAAQEQDVLNRLQTGELPYWNLPAKRPKPTPSPATT
ncbi:MAG TPA: hypothetical protein VFL27_09065 [Candidatus Dormibacteraeota bacterium]|nr:hypothetical protein [Candidatus Dormibacteraeota bacterium]